MATKIILDCDPGIDDALAIAFAHGHPGLELLGITTVAGNVGLAQTTANALAVCRVHRRGGHAGDRRVRRALPAPRPGRAGGARRVGPGRGRAAGACGRPGGRARHRLHHQHRPRRSGRDHPGGHRAADQHRAGGAAGAAAPRLGAGFRDHGRVVGARQHDAGRRVQHVGRPGGRGDGVRGGLDGEHAGAGRDPADRRPRGGAAADARAGPARHRAAAAGPRAVPVGGRFLRAAGARRVRGGLGRAA